jgi:hypothetical protein
MLLYAIVHAVKTLPLPRGRGVCPACGGKVLARCGAIRVHHWAHESGQECDSWSEGIGPWHLAWQRLVEPAFVEVPRGPHRADILGSDDTVIELQHSPLTPAAIAARERHYGKMVWLIDATQRFGGLVSGDRFFFSFGRTRHLEACRKPVVLDFQAFLVEVEALTNVLNGFAGFGLIRDKAWFVERYLAGRRSAVPVPHVSERDKGLVCWQGKSPWRPTRSASEWIDPRRRIKVRYPEQTPYIALDFSWENHRQGRTWPVWWDIVAHHPQLANGWTQADLLEMQSLLHGMPMILGG